MTVEPLTPFVCPLDGAPLAADEQGAGCEHGHRYDRAREGYLNLLPVQHKASRDPGDDKAMVAARRRIADGGHFAPLNEALFAWLREYAARGTLRVLDAGCGEGHTLASLASRAEQDHRPAQMRLAGYDISKWAVRAAARRTHKVAWAVASNRQPPLPPASVDVLLSLFGFAHWPSFAALLAPGGRLLTVDAEAGHLLELREVIYPEVAIAAETLPPEALARGWRVARTHSVRYPLLLESPAALQDLVAMTPHGHRITASGRAALATLTRLTVSMSMVMREWLPPGA
ncbi:MAG: methyltransferase domain-containing protein [Gammaproteobacteria bacterium]|nr:methyltransferase domain-containing protein [Gammaproteobacteria bacterium]